MTVPELFINFIIFFVGIAVIATVIVGCIAAYMIIKGINRMRHEEWEIAEDMSRMKAEMPEFLQDSDEPMSRRLRKCERESDWIERSWVCVPNYSYCDSCFGYYPSYLLAL